MRLYNSEQTLVEDFLTSLAVGSPWGTVSTGSEFFYQRGKTDVIAVDEDGLVIAFEAKLTKWREALQQAYRNKCFAHRSYVVLPKATALLAYRHAAAFNRRRVGICYVEEQAVIILQDASEEFPLQPWLSARAKAHAFCTRQEHATS